MDNGGIPSHSAQASLDGENGRMNDGRAALTNPGEAQHSPNLRNSAPSRWAGLKSTTEEDNILSRKHSAYSFDYLLGKRPIPGAIPLEGCPNPCPSEQCPPAGHSPNPPSRLLSHIRSHYFCKDFANEIIRFSVALIFFILVVAMMTLAQMFSDRWFDQYSKDVLAERDKIATNLLKMNYSSASVAQNEITLMFPNARDQYSISPLYDKLFQVLPDLSRMRGFLPDALLTSFLVLSILVTFVFPSKVLLRYQSVVVGRRVLWILSLLYIFRMCSFLVTTVPSPLYDCVPQYPSGPAEYALLMFKMATGKISACTDNIYSGHTTLASVLFFTNLVYSGRWYFAVYSFFHAGSVLVTLLLARLHYSVDILIALFMTSFLYCLYHFLLLVAIDGRLLGLLSLTRERLAQEGGDGRLLDERKIFLRLISPAIIVVLGWMDGMDLRLDDPVSMQRYRQLLNHSLSVSPKSGIPSQQLLRASLAMSQGPVAFDFPPSPVFLPGGYPLPLAYWHYYPGGAGIHLPDVNRPYDNDYGQDPIGVNMTGDKSGNVNCKDVRSA